MNSSPAVELRNVKVNYSSRNGFVQAVRGVSLSVYKGKILGIVGESGCGKSTIAKAILKLVPYSDGEIFISGKDLSKLKGKELREERLNFQMIFQDPYSSLNPRKTIYDTLKEGLLSRGKFGAEELAQRAGYWMEKVGLNSSHLKRYPHEFSGGQRQRIAIARALSTEPSLLIADEPVSALDVSVQSQILNLLRQLCSELDLTVLFISHDLSVVHYLADEIAVMYLGEIVEYGSAEKIMNQSKHLYTQSLIDSIPTMTDRTDVKRMTILQGDPPSPLNPPKGCAFAYRSPLNFDRSLAERPGEWTQIAEDHWVDLHPGTVADF